MTRWRAVRVPHSSACQVVDEDGTVVYETFSWETAVKLAENRNDTAAALARGELSEIPVRKL